VRWLHGLADVGPVFQCDDFRSDVTTGGLGLLKSVISGRKPPARYIAGTTCFSGSVHRLALTIRGAGIVVGNSMIFGVEEVDKSWDAQGRLLVPRERRQSLLAEYDAANDCSDSRYIQAISLTSH
jgi:hypothetical protein